MLILRLTQKTRKRLGRSADARTIEEGESTTLLGDWYVNLIRFGREQLVLYTSSTTRLPLVCPARELAKRIDSQLRDGLETFLLDLGAEEAAVRRELNEMKLIAYAKTADRSVLGTMTEFAKMLPYHRHNDPDGSLLELSRWLAETPCKTPQGTVFPIDRAVELLGGVVRKRPRPWLV